MVSAPFITTMTEGNMTTPDAATQWEYKVNLVELGPFRDQRKSLERRLNELGREGWELISGSTEEGYGA